MNNEKNPRDLGEEQAVLVRNMSVDNPGIIKSGGSMYAHSASSIGGGILPSSIYISNRGGSDLNKARLSGSGGYNLFYFESDHENSYTYSVTHQTVDSSAATDAEIKFTQPSTTASSGFSDPSSFIEPTESG